MWDRMRDTRHGHRKEEMEGACVCCRQPLLERFIGRCVCVRNELWRLLDNDLKKKKVNVCDG